MDRPSIFLPSGVVRHRRAGRDPAHGVGARAGGVRRRCGRRRVFRHGQAAAEVREYTPVGVRAQLVMAVAERFDYAPAKLRRLRAEDDKSTIAACPMEHEAMLGVVKMTTLAEALY